MKLFPIYWLPPGYGNLKILLSLGLILTPTYGFSPSCVISCYLAHPLLSNTYTEGRVKTRLTIKKWFVNLGSMYKGWFSNWFSQRADSAIRVEDILGSKYFLDLFYALWLNHCFLICPKVYGKQFHIPQATCISDKLSEHKRYSKELSQIHFKEQVSLTLYSHPYQGKYFYGKCFKPLMPGGMCDLFVTTRH